MLMVTTGPELSMRITLSDSYTCRVTCTGAGSLNFAPTNHPCALGLHPGSLLTTSRTRPATVADTRNKYLQRTMYVAHACARPTPCHAHVCSLEANTTLVSPLQLVWGCWYVPISARKHRRVDRDLVQPASTTAAVAQGGLHQRAHLASRPRRVHNREPASTREALGLLGARRLTRSTHNSRTNSRTVQTVQVTVSTQREVGDAHDKAG
jgi:hypothetical protein